MTNSSIVKTFFGKHIDLSKVVSISDAEFIDRMGYGGWFVGFELHIQLLDKPIKYERALEYNESKFTIEDGHELTLGRDRKTPLAVENLQKQVDELINQWKKVSVTN